MTPDEKSEVRPCLESVMKLVSQDLEDTNENGSTCHTLPSIAAVFAPGAYREEDGYMIAEAFNNAKGFHHLGSYLMKRVDLLKEGARQIESPSLLIAVSFFSFNGKYLAVDLVDDLCGGKMVHLPARRISCCGKTCHALSNIS